MKKLNINDFKNFKPGDLIVATSQRSGIDGRPSTIGLGKYVRDISYDEAVVIHTKIMQRSFPSMGFTEETVREVLEPNEKYFLTESGEARTYDNHERADIFDIRYIEGKENWEKLQIEKDEFIKAHKVTPFDDFHYRIYPELIKD